MSNTRTHRRLVEPARTAGARPDVRRPRRGLLRGHDAAPDLHPAHPDRAGRRALVRSGRRIAHHAQRHDPRHREAGKAGHGAARPRRRRTTAAPPSCEITAAGRKARRRIDQLMRDRARAVAEAFPEIRRAEVLRMLQRIQSRVGDRASAAAAAGPDTALTQLKGKDHGHENSGCSEGTLRRGGARRAVRMRLRDHSPTRADHRLLGRGPRPGRRGQSRPGLRQSAGARRNSRRHDRARPGLAAPVSTPFSPGGASAPPAA